LALLERACVLNPNMALAWCSAGVVQTHMGDPDRGIASIERAIRLSPLDPNLDVFLRGVARAHLIAGRYDDAIAWGERALREKPGLPHALRTLTAAYALAGNIAEAHRVLAMLRQFQPSFRLSNARENIPPYRRPQDTEMILNGLRIAGLPE
jgi:tetratricopeptide (TPR) repeat protein